MYQGIFTTQKQGKHKSLVQKNEELRKIDVFDNSIVTMGERDSNPDVSNGNTRRCQLSCKACANKRRKGGSRYSALRSTESLVFILAHSKHSNQPKHAKYHLLLLFSKVIETIKNKSTMTSISHKSLQPASSSNCPKIL